MELDKNMQTFKNKNCILIFSKTRYFYRLCGKKMQNNSMIIIPIVLLCTILFVYLAPPVATQPNLYLTSIVTSSGVLNPNDIINATSGYAYFNGTSNDHAWLIGEMNHELPSKSVIAVYVCGGRGTLAMYVGDSGDPNGSWTQTAGSPRVVNGPGWYYFKTPVGFAYISIAATRDIALNCVKIL